MPCGETATPNFEQGYLFIIAASNSGGGACIDYIARIGFAGAKCPGRDA